MQGSLFPKSKQSLSLLTLMVYACLVIVSIGVESAQRNSELLIP